MRDQPAGGCPAQADQKDTPWDSHGSYHAPRAIQAYTRETPRDKSKQKRVSGTTHDPTPPTSSFEQVAATLTHNCTNGKERRSVTLNPNEGRA